MNSLKKNYKYYETADGSLSLEYCSDSSSKEVMHHSGGAVRESLYIYLPTLEWAASNVQGPINILSLGFGVGINELISIAYSIKNNLPIGIIDSYESDSWLTEQFTCWLKKQKCSLEEVYETNLKLISKHFALSPDDVCNVAAQLLASNQLQFSGAITSELNFKQRYHTIYYDFFSSKMDDLFWSADFLTHFLSISAESRCAFSTYASTSRLKNALKSQHFSIEKKQGFAGKRECTFAFRAK